MLAPGVGSMELCDVLVEHGYPLKFKLELEKDIAHSPSYVTCDSPGRF